MTGKKAAVKPSKFDPGALAGLWEHRKTKVLVIVERKLLTPAGAVWGVLAVRKGLRPGQIMISRQELDEKYRRKNDRQTAETNTFGYRISTVFLGLDHNFTGEGPPVLWETMVFPELPSGEIQKRYSSHEDALAGHEKIVEKVRDELRRKRAKRG